MTTPRQHVLSVGLFTVLSLAVVYHHFHRDVIVAVEEAQRLEGAQQVLVVSESANERCHCQSGTNGSVGKRVVTSLSVCGQEADRRGPHQDVVAYTLFGNPHVDDQVRRRYFGSLDDRASRVAEAYPGWTMRIYHNATTKDYETHLCPLRCRHNHVDLCDVRIIQTETVDAGSLRGLNPRMWRFLVMIDPLVDRFLCRDIDSLIVNREQAAVSQWLTSNYTFHVMRDHPSHGGFMLAGLWGAKTVQRRDLVRRLGQAMIWTSHNDRYQTDQNRLDALVWPFATFDVMAHDAYFCEDLVIRFAQRVPSFPFPTKRVGRNYTGYDLVRTDIADHITPCPLKCRPPQHQDWTFC